MTAVVHHIPACPFSQRQKEVPELKGLQDVVVVAWYENVLAFIAKHMA